MIEEWRNIKEYEGFYQVSNLGRVRSIDRIVDTNIKYVTKRLHKGRILKQHKNNKGYFYVILSKKGVIKKELVHILVARAFQEICGEWFEGAEVNHKSEIPTENFATNLEWCTHKYNMNYNDVMKRKVAPKLMKTEEEKKKNRYEYLEKTKEHRKEVLHKWYLKNRKLKGTTNKKAVLQYTLDMEFVREWESATLAYNTIMGKNKDNGCHITSCCKGNRKSAYGYVWKYKNINNLI